MAQNTVVVLGASNDRNKFGNKAVRAYLKKGWIVYPVNPNESEIEGLKCYKSVRDVPRPVNRVTVYLPPKIGIGALDDLVALNAPEVFFNPGSDAPEVVEKATALGLNPIAACSIVDIGMSPAQFPA
jgi:predicted CoA-binding protein